MTITLGNTTLCAGQARNSTGSPVGPRDIKDAETPGVVLREYVGADRVAGDRVRCDHGVVTFGVTRTYGSVADATAYALTGHRSEDTVGALQYDDSVGALVKDLRPDVWALGLGAAYDTVVGPLKLNVHWSNIHKWGAYISLGFDF